MYLLHVSAFSTDREKTGPAVRTKLPDAACRDITHGAEHEWN
jgi:hypothetical protein